MIAATVQRGNEFAGKTVLLRADFANGVTRELSDAVRALAARNMRVAVVGGYGAPRGDINLAFSLRQFRHPLESESGVPVTFIPGCVGSVAEAELGRVPYGQAALLENVRFHSDEARDSRSFAVRLSALGDYFAITGPVPSRPMGWITELARILPAIAVPSAATTIHEA